jgi:hypothetical protein
VGEKKYDETAASMIALFRYGSGIPWNRLEGLEKNLGIPLPSSTQCEIVAETAPTLQPALDELIRQAAQGEVAHNDDTSMRVLSLDRDADISPERTGVFTSGIVWIFGGTPYRAVFHWVQTRRGEPCRNTETAASWTAASHSNVRRTIAECGQSLGVASDSDG